MTAMDARLHRRDEPPPVPLVRGDLVPGFILNDIFRVDRFVARGGMGDVYAGTNVEADEKVAIKVVLPHLAADPKVLALFRSEARLLMRVSHPAVAAYRVFAREARLDMHYIATEFVDGEPLSDRFRGAPADLAETLALLRRLAGGLEATHAVGAIHRDLTPDNILLPGGRVEQARIIDFGIARSVDPGLETVVIEGFAGKLSYVAPEQFGLFGGEIGPWTDIFSAGLVTLAFARGRPLDMGRTVSEAVDRRRVAVALDDAPEALRPVLSAMLAPDPAARARSMAAVMATLDRVGTAPPMARTPRPTRPAPAEVSAVVAKTAPPRRIAVARRGAWIAKRRALLARLAAEAAALAVVGGIAIVTPPPRLTRSSSPAARVSSASPAPIARRFAGGAPSPSSPPARVEAPAAPAIPTVAPTLIVPDTIGYLGWRVRGCGGGPAYRLSVSVRGTGPAGTMAVGLLYPHGETRLLRLDRTISGYAAAACIHHPGVEAVVLVAGSGVSALGKVQGGSPYERLNRLGGLATHQGWTMRYAWLTVAYPGRTAASAVAAQRVAASATPAAMPLPAEAPPPAAAKGSGTESILCRRFDGKTWHDIGYTSRADCLALVRARWRTAYGQVGSQIVRRSGGVLEVQADGGWRPIQDEGKTLAQ